MYVVCILTPGVFTHAQILHAYPFSGDIGHIPTPNHWEIGIEVLLQLLDVQDNYDDHRLQSIDDCPWNCTQNGHSLVPLEQCKCFHVHIRSPIWQPNGKANWRSVDDIMCSRQAPLFSQHWKDALQYMTKAHMYVRHDEGTSMLWKKLHQDRELVMLRRSFNKVLVGR